MINRFLSLLLIKKTIFIIVILLILYLLVCFNIVLIKVLKMVNQNKKCRRIDEGKQRFSEVEKELGKSSYNLYSEEEIKKNPSLEKVKLYYFPPNIKNTEKTNFTIFIPGGGYYSSDPALVSFGASLEYNELGLNCFVLEYRIKKDAHDLAPLQDLVKAINFIMENSEQFRVNKTNYNLTGFSAGGHLACLFSIKASEFGLEKPASLNLIYPWINLGEKVKLSGNAVYDLIQGIEQHVGKKNLLGSKRIKEDVDNIDIMKNIDSSFPPCFILQGDNDFVLSYKQNSEEFIKVLDKNNIKYEYKLLHGVNHGFGVGFNTAAHGWTKDSYNFYLGNLDNFDKQ